MEMTAEKHTDKNFIFYTNVFETYLPLWVSAMFTSPACLLRSFSSHFFSFQEFPIGHHSFPYSWKRFSPEETDTDLSLSE